LRKSYTAKLNRIIKERKRNPFWKIINCKSSFLQTNMWKFLCYNFISKSLWTKRRKF